MEVVGSVPLSLSQLKKQYALACIFEGNLVLPQLRSVLCVCINSFPRIRSMKIFIQITLSFLLVTTEVTLLKEGK